MKTIHTFRIVDETDHLNNNIFPETDMKICSEASLEDIVHAFERFLQAAGYYLPNNSYLDFIEEQTLPISKYEGEF